MKQTLEQLRKELAWLEEFGLDLRLRVEMLAGRNWEASKRHVGYMVTEWECAVASVRLDIDELVREAAPVEVVDAGDVRAFDHGLAGLHTAGSTFGDGKHTVAVMEAEVVKLGGTNG